MSADRRGLIGTLGAVFVVVMIVIAANTLRSSTDGSTDESPDAGFTPATISAMPDGATSRAEIDRLSPRQIAGAALGDRGKVAEDVKDAKGDKTEGIPKGAQSLARQAEGLAGNQPFSFVLTSFNVLGSQHTRAGKNAERFASGQVRARAAASLIASYGSTVVGLQELQRDQLAVLAGIAGDRWAFYPGTTLGGSGVPQSMMWDTAVWEPTFTGSITIPFVGTTRPQPIVRLRHRETNREIYVLNVHNSPRDRQGRENERDKAEQIEIAAVQELRKDEIPVFVIGDFNEKADAFCAFAGKAGLQAAQGGTAEAGSCRPPAAMRVDWLFGTRDITFSDFRFDTSPAVRRITDHAVLTATVSVP
ncbi:hypothetical protein GCM10027020_02680 [Nocardioides salsibiostraticola]